MSIGMDEPSYIYSLNPIIYGLFSSNSDIVLKAVDFMKTQSKMGFDWVGEVNIYKDEKIIQEIDIVAIIDGKISVCECKESARMDNKQIDRYVRLCKNNKIDKMFFYSEKKHSEAKKKSITARFKDCDYTELIFN